MKNLIKYYTYLLLKGKLFWVAFFVHRAVNCLFVYSCFAPYSERKFIRAF
jgi:hypothetical protein